jgi:FG-GAP-like repeat/PASTA domain/FG-GAP repeat
MRLGGEHTVARVVKGRPGSLSAYGFAVVLTCVGVAMTFGVAGPSGSSVPSFASARNYVTAPGPLSIAVGDLNGDGKPDLATANPATDTSTDTVSVLLNRGDGSFRARRNYRTGGSPLALAIRDLNGDAKPELVTANYGASTVSVLLNKGDGSFQAKRDYAAGEYPRSVAIGDPNGDGKPDLAIVNHVRDGTVSVLANKGDGSFRARRVYRARLKHPGSVAIADLNRDGKPDLATANHDGRAVSVLLNKGDGTFKARRDYATGYGPFWIDIGDVNGDGKPDLVFASMATTGRDTHTVTVSVLRNRGDGSFGARRDFEAGDYPEGRENDPNALALGDLNGDRKPELAIACCYRALVSVLTNRGDGSFLPKLEYRTGRPWRTPEPPYEWLSDRASAVSIDDLNGDGKPDLAVANYPSGTVSVLLNAPGLCTVQDARGGMLTGAKQTIARAKCRVGKVRRAYSRTVKKDRVISQNPKPGTVLPNGGKVNLVVSLGRKQ